MVAYAKKFIGHDAKFTKKYRPLKVGVENLHSISNLYPLIVYSKMQEMSISNIRLILRRLFTAMMCVARIYCIKAELPVMTGPQLSVDTVSNSASNNNIIYDIASNVNTSDKDAAG